MEQRDQFPRARGIVCHPVKTTLLVRVRKKRREIVLIEHSDRSDTSDRI